MVTVPSLFSLIGRTPLVDLTSVSDLPSGVRLFAKAEFMNPSGSVKDRAAASMLADGLERGGLTPGDGSRTIIDATSGNTGISLAMLGAALGVPVTLVMPENTSAERKAIMTDFGAAIVTTDPADGSDGAFLTVRELVARDPEAYFYTDQYNNPANPRAHETGTAAEIWEQTHGLVTHFVAAMGTSGTFTGTARGLKALIPSVRAIAVQPDSPLHGIEGTKHMPSTITPGILDDSLIDKIQPVSTEWAYEMTRRLARAEGLFCGVSSGANVAAALNVARDVPDGSVIVTVLPDSGSRYLSDHFWRGDRS